MEVADAQTLHNLRERVKELTALHRTARLLQDHQRSSVSIMQEIAGYLPEAWQYPDITGARISFGDLEVSTPHFQNNNWVQLAEFRTTNGQRGAIEICYTEERSEAAEGPFLAEERDLLESLAEMLRSHFQHRLADEALLQVRQSLERQVRDRTAQLERANEALLMQINEQQQTALRIEAYQRQLKRLNLELSLAEVRERREIASDLHDHIGQALAFIKLRVSQFRGNAVFCGFEDSMDEIISLLDRTIAYTRSLTVQISPPILHEFGLVATLEWIAEQYQKEYGLRVEVRSKDFRGTAKGEYATVLFKATKELLSNAARHSGGSAIAVTVRGNNSLIYIEVADNGRSFDADSWRDSLTNTNKYGLFSVRERMKSLGGDMTINSQPGKGTTVTISAPLPSGAVA